ncbi:alpha-amylase family glycosyl hydrolase [Streptomyces sp. B8F3]|uniref:alpha-amylase family glycosyl hydrolase n=1 Tax=Streptomyces sp. B8F3 TaxID=3153573 RepID=UPI00325D9FA3
MREFIAAYDAALPPDAWPNRELGSHDISRVATRLGPARARAALVLLLTLRGTPVLYYGDEIGMADVPVPPAHARDPWGSVEPGAGRDPARTPMRWDATSRAGFTAAGAVPRLPIRAAGESPGAGPDVASQAADPSSTLLLVRDLLRLCKEHPALATGDQRLVPAPLGVLAYLRQQGTARFLVAVNTADAAADLPLAHEGLTEVSTDHRRRGGRRDCSLRPGPHEACVVRLDAP